MIHRYPMHEAQTDGGSERMLFLPLNCSRESHSRCSPAANACQVLRALQCSTFLRARSPGLYRMALGIRGIKRCEGAGVR